MRKLLCSIAVLSAVAAADCESKKSFSPLSPSVAGPIAGVSISAPQPVSPSAGSRIAAQDPIILTVQNAATTGVRPLLYMFEVASDSEFAQKMYSRAGIAPGEQQTSHRLADSLSPGRTYYWHARAEDGANIGAFTGAVAFTVYTPVVIGLPGAVEPVNGVTVTSSRPSFVVTNAPRTGPAGAITYTLDVALDVAFSQRLLLHGFPEQPNQTRMTLDQDLPAGKQIFWRAMASDPENQGPWFPTQVFTTAAAPTPPRPGPGRAPND
jgi:hypothetical protein